MIYNYILIALRLFVGLLTDKIMILTAFVGLGIYLLWVFGAVAFSFGRKFYKRCDKLTKFVNENEKSEENLNIILEKSKKISSGLASGIKTFMRNGSGYPSNYISKTSALDSEVTGGIFNHGKSFMRAYITVSSLFLLLMNFAYLGADKTITGTLISEIAFLPLIYFVVIRLFYFLYTSTQQQFYKIDVDKLSELVDALDEKYGARQQAFVTVKQDFDVLPEQTENKEIFENDKFEQVQENEETVVSSEQPQTDVVEVKEEAPKKTLDDYDFFKKKNIDVEKLVNEVPTSSSSSALPFIDVDSDFEIKDDKNETKVYNEQSDLVTRPEEENKQENTNDSFDSKNESISAKTNSEATPSLSHFNESGSEKNVNSEILNKATEIEKNDVESKTTDADDSIANLVGRFLSTKPNTTESRPVSKQSARVTHKSLREKLAESESNSITKSGFQNNQAGARPYYNQGMQNQTNGRGNPMSNFLNMGKSSFENQPYGTTQTGFNPQSNFYGGFNGVNGLNSQSQNVDTGNAKPIVKKPVLQKPVLRQSKSVEQKPVVQTTQVETPPAVKVQSVQPYQPVKPIEPKQTIKPVAKPIEPKPVVLQENKPAESKTVSSANAIAATVPKEKGKRGRPAKQVFDENVTIKNDAEFEAVLSRAEKLMRKSEEGLSASQSKRVEKELKSLLDAMNRYKETN